MNTITTPVKRYSPAAAVRGRYGGISDTTLWRWLQDPELGFPQPIKIRNIRYFDNNALDEFDRKQAINVDKQAEPAGDAG